MIGNLRTLTKLKEVQGFTMRQYLDLLGHILDEGVEKTQERTGTGTKAVFPYYMKFDLRESFPLLTTKRMFLRGIITELLWMVSGSNNIRPLVLEGVNIWNEWPFQKYLSAQGLGHKYPKYSAEWKEQLNLFVERVKNDKRFAEIWGSLGPVYGYLWRHWRGRNGNEVDQLARVINLIKTKPDDRRLIVNAWYPSELEYMALPPCHMLFQFFVSNGELSCQMYQRSVDVFLGLPFNIAQYAMLAMMVAQVTDLKPGYLHLCLGDTHIYLNHLDQAREQLTRAPKPLPQMQINPEVINIDSFKIGDFAIQNYNPYPAIKAPISV